MPEELFPEWKGRELKGEPPFTRGWGLWPFTASFRGGLFMCVPLDFPCLHTCRTDTCLGDPFRPSPHLYQMPPILLHPITHKVKISNSVTRLSSCSYF